MELKKMHDWDNQKNEQFLHEATAFAMRQWNDWSWSKVFIPSRFDFAMISLIFGTSPLRIRSAISGERSMISMAAIRPLPPLRGNSR